MLYWDTGDRVVDCILQKLEGLSTWHLDSDAASTDQLLSGLIHIQEMLPRAVALHFILPNLFVGNAHFDRGTDYRRKLVFNITDALKRGLDAAADDQNLKRENETNFSDRPLSRGEEILHAVKLFSDNQSKSSLSRLQLAVSPTRLQSRVKTIEMLMTRKRTYGNQSPELAMLGELHRLEFEAEGYHGEKA